MRLLVAFALFLGSGLAGCGVAPLVLCDQIPEGGCPVDRGGTCDDKECAAIYGCYDAEWKVQEVCEGNTGGGGAGGSTGTAGGGGGATGGAGGGECTPLELDHSTDTTGCMPDLQSPDCPAAAAESCQEKACSTGCLDFFLCKASGWVAVAYCDEDGSFFVVPR